MASLGTTTTSLASRVARCQPMPKGSSAGKGPQPAVLAIGNYFEATFTLHTKHQSYLVNKSLLARNCSYFRIWFARPTRAPNAADSLDMRYEDGHEGAFQSLLEFVHTGAYTVPCADGGVLEHHMRAYDLANVYNVPEMKAYAIEKILAATHPSDH